MLLAIALFISVIVTLFILWCVYRLIKYRNYHVNNNGDVVPNEPNKEAKEPVNNEATGVIYTPDFEKYQHLSPSNTELDPWEELLTGDLHKN